MEIVPGLAGLPARLKWVRQTYLGLRSPRQMSKAMTQHYRGSKRKGLSHVTIWRYEEGERTPTAVELYNIAEFANVSPAWLLTGEGAVEPGAATDYSAGARDAALEMWQTLESIWIRHGGTEGGEKKGDSGKRGAKRGKPSAGAVEDAVAHIPKVPTRGRRARGA